MVAAEVCAGAFVAEQLEHIFAEENDTCAQFHNAKYGCYSCKVVRA